MNSSLSNAIRDTVPDVGPDEAHFGRRLHNLRRTLCMDLEQLSHRSGIAAITLEELEHDARVPPLRLLERLCSGLDLPFNRLVGK